MTQELLPPGMAEDVLLFLDMPAYPERSPAGLTSLYRRWCRMVPFDNIRKLIAVRRGDPGPLPGDTATDFFRALLDDGVGGTCWAANGALCALLQALGFDAVRAVGTMMVAPDIPPNHGSVLVRFGREHYVADASILCDLPLAVIPGETSRVEHPAWGVAGHWQDGAFMIRWQPLQRDDAIDCRIDRFEVDADRFRAQHEATRGWSPFNYELTFNVIDMGGRIGIAQGHAVTIDEKGVRTRTPLVDRTAFLVDSLGVSERIAAEIPPDVPTPPPPGSRTARATSEL
jgi:N-hydroxyarylamine O-acetyltransferase